MSANAATLLPIFPLNAVLFPEGVLPLRIFEARYTDMVRDCLREEREFGVCLIKKGHEVQAGPAPSGPRTEPETIGCRARIVSWDMEQLGVLQIATIGTERFRIQNLQVEANGLAEASTLPLDDETQVPLSAEFQSCAILLDRIITQLQDSKEGNVEGKLPIAEPHRLQDTTWVGNRLCEILPISLVAKQKLMELTDAPTRLSIVHQYLLQKKII